VPSQPRRAIAASQNIPTERRLKFRFPLPLGVRFRPLKGRLPYGAGRAINVSSGGILVVVEQVVPEQVILRHEITVGALVEMSVEWPSLLDGRVPLQLFALARVVRHRSSDFAAVFEKYQFRTLRI
jgi:PilZ domain